MLAQQTVKKRKKVVRANPTKAAEKISKKNNATSSKEAARKRYEEAEKKFKERQGKLSDLNRRISESKNARDKQSLEKQVQAIQTELSQDDAEMKDANAEAEKYENEEKQLEMMEVDDEVDVTDDEGNNDPDKPRKSTEAFDRSISLLDALLSKQRIDTSLHGLDPNLLTGAGLRESQAVVGYKSSGPYGRIAIVGDEEIPGSPIFRLRKNVTIDESKVKNIVEDRRAGKVNPYTKKAWGIRDMETIFGIAIAVPEGYSGNPEDLTAPIKKLTGTEKDNLRKQGKPIPRQPDIQLGIQWKEPMEAGGSVQSWENRTGCRSIWKKAADSTIMSYAKHYEEGYRNGGGRHSSEEPSISPLDIPPAGRSLSPGETPDPDQQPSTTTTRENTPGVIPPDPKKKVQDEDPRLTRFREIWCGVKNIDPTNIKPKEEMAMRMEFMEL